MTRSVFAGWAGLTSVSNVHETLRAMCADGGGGAREQEIAHGDGWALGWVNGTPGVAVERSHGEGVLLRLGSPRIGDQNVARSGSDTGAVLRSLGNTDAAGSRPGGSFLLLALGVPGLPTLRAAVDRFAVYPLYHARVAGGVVFGSTPLVVARHPQVRATISPQAIYDFLYSSVVFSPDTVYQGVSSLPPGRYLDLGAAGISVGTYWRAAFGSPGEVRRAPGAGELEARVRDAVAAHLGAGQNVGCFLSGGIDSSTVTGMVRAITGEPPQTFSIGFDAAGYDEMRYARIVSRHFATRHHEYYVTPDDIVDLFPSVIAAYGQPFGNASVIPTLCCARLAREHGITRMLAGDGGDELFGGNERYAQQQILGLYQQRLPGWMRRRLIEPVLDHLGPAQRVPVLRKAVSYVSQANVSLPDRLETYNHLRRIGPGRVLSADFLAQVDTEHPRNAKREIYTAVAAVSELDRILGLDFKITLADSDLPKVTVMCAQAGVDVRFPFLDDGLLDLSARLAPRYKATFTRLRGFFKDSMRDFLPPEVIAKRKQGFGLPFGVWVIEHPRLREFAFALLDSARERGIVSSPFIDELRDTLLPQHPGYYGPLVWDIMVLEAWLQAHGSGNERAVAGGNGIGHEPAWEA